MTLEITDIQPEKMRVCRVGMVITEYNYTVEIYKPRSDTWFIVAEHSTPIDALQDAINWYYKGK